MIVEDLRKEKVLDRGVLHWFANGMIQRKMTARELAAVVAARKLSLTKLPRADEQEAAQLGATGVPFFVIDRRFGVVGAQPPETLLAALERAWEARTAA